MPADGAGRLLRAVARHRRSRAAPANTPSRHYDRSALSRCSKRRGGTPTGERAAISARRAEARSVDHASAGVPPSFFLFSILALRAWIGINGRISPPASLNDRSKADASCRFRAACRTPRMPAASRERWRLDSPLSSGKANVVKEKIICGVDMSRSGLISTLFVMAVYYHCGKRRDQICRTHGSWIRHFSRSDGIKKCVRHMPSAGAFGLTIGIRNSVHISSLIEDLVAFGEPEDTEIDYLFVKRLVCL